jgi:multiple sugar transport system permease protein
MSRRAKRRIKTLVSIVGLLILIVLVLSPYIWLVLTSFKTRNDAFSIPPRIIFTPTLDNYVQALFNRGYIHNLINSAVVASCSTAVSLLVGVPAAYALARFRVRTNSLYLVLLLAARVLPAVALTIPLFILFKEAGLLTSYAAVIASHITFNLPFVIWMMRGFFLAIPPELDEAAVVDGCSYFGAFVRVVLPLTRGGLAATAIFCVINSWNDFLFAFLLTGRETATLTAVIPNLVTSFGTSWGQVAAVGTVTTLPVLLFAFAVQKYLVRGMTGGAVRG